MCFHSVFRVPMQDIDRGCKKLLLSITVKLVCKVMRVFYSHTFGVLGCMGRECVAKLLVAAS